MEKPLHHGHSEVHRSNDLFLIKPAIIEDLRQNYRARKERKESTY